MNFRTGTGRDGRKTHVDQTDTIYPACDKKWKFPLTKQRDASYRQLCRTEKDVVPKRLLQVLNYATHLSAEEREARDKEAAEWQ